MKNKRMKRLLILFALCVTSYTTFAQRTKHLECLGVEMGGPVNQFKHKLEKKGFKVLKYGPYKTNEKQLSMGVKIAKKTGTLLVRDIDSQPNVKVVSIKFDEDCFYEIVTYFEKIYGSKNVIEHDELPAYMTEDTEKDGMMQAYVTAPNGVICIVRFEDNWLLPTMVVYQDGEDINDILKDSKNNK